MEGSSSLILCLRCRRESNDERQLNAARTSTERELLSTVQTLKKETKVLKRKLESYPEISDRYTREVNNMTTLQKQQGLL